MILEILKQRFTVCKLNSAAELPLETEFCFVGKTDRELSLVCPEENVPQNTLAREDGWRCFRVEGTLDFSLVGILSSISSKLAEAGIPIFAVSTFDTDYILVKETQFIPALEILRAAGHQTKGRISHD